jgi:DNA-binding transcriptional LysR family regulator
LLPYAERAVAALREGGERVASLRGERGGQLVIGAPPGVSTYTLPEILKRYATTYPGVTVNVRTGSSEAVLDLILRGEAQVGFGRLLRHPEIDCAPLFEEELVLVVDPEHAFVREPRVTVDDIALERVILFDAASSYYNVTWAWFDAARVRVRQTMELDNIEAAKRMVEHGLGVALLPQTAVQRDVREGRLRLIPVDGGGPPRRKIVAYLRRDHPAGREVTGFLRIAREMISQTTAEGGLRR